MPKYKVIGYTKVQIVTLVEADNEEEAKQEAESREIEICIHGSELADDAPSETDWVLGDCSFDAGIEIDDVEEVDADGDEIDEEDQENDEDED